MKKFLIFTLVFAVNISAQAADSFSTLEERMTGKEFTEAGLGKLTNEELSTLNDWIRRHSIATLETAATPSAASAVSTGQVEDIRGFENQPKDNAHNEDINSSIVGTFSGWRGIDTQFKLANGMIWQQVEADTFYVEPTENAEIVIKKGLLGGWRLSMVGYGSSVRVKRIK